MIVQLLLEDYVIRTFIDELVYGGGEGECGGLKPPFRTGDGIGRGIGIGSGYKKNGTGEGDGLGSGFGWDMKGNGSGYSPGSGFEGSGFAFTDRKEAYVVDGDGKQ